MHFISYMKSGESQEISLEKVRQLPSKRRHLRHAAPENRTRTNRWKLQGGRFQSNMKKKTKNKEQKQKTQNGVQRNFYNFYLDEAAIF